MIYEVSARLAQNIVIPSSILTADTSMAAAALMGDLALQHIWHQLTCSVWYWRERMAGVH